MNFFRRSKRSKSARHPLPPTQNGGSWFRRRRVTTQYPQLKKTEIFIHDRPASSYHENDDIISKINGSENRSTHAPGTPIPDVIPPQDRNTSTEVVQIHTPDPKLSSELVANILPTKDKHERRHRAKSLTHSENDALGTLDEYLMTFDLDDNLNEVSGGVQQNDDPKKSPVNPEEIPRDYEEPHYSTIENTPKDAVVSTTENYTVTGHGLRNIVMHEPLYSKPIKSNKPNTADNKRSMISDEGPPVPSKRFEAEGEGLLKFSDLRKTPSTHLSKSLEKTDWANANVQQLSPKRKAQEDNNNNYSLKRGELSKTVANPNADYRAPPPDYDMKGETTTNGLSATKEYWSGSVTSSSPSGSMKAQKPIRPEVLSLIRSKKETAPQVEMATDGPRLDKLVKRSFRLTRQHSSKEELLSQPSEDEYGMVKRETDKWVASSERLRANSEGKRSTRSLERNSRPGSAYSDSPKKTTRTAAEQRSLPKELVNRSIEVNTTPYEKPISISTSANKTESVKHEDESVQTQSEKLESVATQRNTEEFEQRVNVPAQKMTITTETTSTTVLPAEKPNPEYKRPTSPDRQERAVQNETSKEDEDLIRLMETGITPGNTDITSDPIEFATNPYVPRAVRMSFGSSWEGIKKDRRAWKSRDIGNASKKKTQKLSNRIDEQLPVDIEVEMLF